MTQGRYILTLQCPDAVGIVAAVATFLAERRLSIEESDQFHDLPRDMFFMRTAFSAKAAAAPELGALVNRMRPTGDCKPWTFGASHLMRNLVKRGLC